jgi:hypothetical protein
MQALTKETLPLFVTRFASLNDGVLRELRFKYSASGQKAISVIVSVQDLEAKEGWSNLVILVDEITETAFKEGRATCQVLSSGIVVAWLEAQVWCDFSPSLEPVSIDDFRQSDFYVAGKRVSWEVEPYSDQ